MQDENGCILYDEDGEPTIQTDGTGFISEDLAVLVPNDFYHAQYMKDKDFEVKINFTFHVIYFAILHYFYIRILLKI